MREVALDWLGDAEDSDLPRPRPRPPVIECSLVGVFLEEDSGADGQDALVVIKVVIKFQFSKATAKQQVRDVTILLSLGGEGNSRPGVEILKVGLLQPSGSNRAGDVYEPLPDDDPKVTVKVDSRVSQVILIPGRIPNALCVAVSFRRPVELETARMSVGIKGKVETATRTAPIKVVNSMDIPFNRSSQGDRSPLSWAAGNGWLEFLKSSPTGVAGLEKEDRSGRSPLSWAAGNGCDKIVGFALQEGHGLIDPHRPDKNGRTLLSWASGNGQDKTVDLLLRNGGETSPLQGDRDDRGWTPLSWAAENGCDNAVLALLTFGKKSAEGLAANWDDKDLDGETPLSRAAQKEHEGVIRILVREGLLIDPELDAVPQKSLPWAPRYLHEAAKRGWFGLAKVLIDNKVKVDCVITGDDQDRRTPLCIAAEEGHPQVVQLLLSAGASRDFQVPGKGNTALLLAIGKGNEDVVKVLLEAGVKVDVENTEGGTPMRLATKGKLATILTMLAKRDKDGPLAETETDLKSAVDREFKATVVDFVSRSGIQIPFTTEVPVDQLLKDPRFKRDRSNGSPSFTWLHLPANNVRSRLQCFSPDLTVCR
jgi:ankyrin repeat protein